MIVVYYNKDLSAKWSYRVIYNYEDIYELLCFKNKVQEMNRCTMNYRLWFTGALSYDFVDQFSTSFFVEHMCLNLITCLF